MCTYSMVMDWAKSQPKEVWVQPYWPNQLEDLVKRAAEYDKKNNEPNCELEEKKETIRRLAKQFGVKIRFLDEEAAEVEQKYE